MCDWLQDNTVKSEFIEALQFKFQMWSAKLDLHIDNAVDSVPTEQQC